MDEENARIMLDKLSHLTVLEADDPEVINKLGIISKGEDGSFTLTPDSELGLFFTGLLEKEMLKTAYEKLQITDSQSKLNFAVKKMREAGRGIENWLVVGNLGGNKWLLNKFYDKNQNRVFKTGCFKNLNIGDNLLPQVPGLADATPDDIKKAGFVLGENGEVMIKPDCELALFFFKITDNALILSVFENFKQKRTRAKKSSRKKSGE